MRILLMYTASPQYTTHPSSANDEWVHVKAPVTDMPPQEDTSNAGAAEEEYNMVTVPNHVGKCNHDYNDMNNNTHIITNSCACHHTYSSAPSSAWTTHQPEDYMRLASCYKQVSMDGPVAVSLDLH
jgi:hypothetical protein